jgi:hypothetical protein
MPKCNDTNIETIDSNECLRTSLAKINDNFTQLNDLTCTLRERVDSAKQIRTFFYYGPNADVAPASGMNDGELSRPSNLTIEAFTNSPSQLNLPSLSREGDVAYVIYQKTGFKGSLPSASSGFNPETGNTQSYSAGRSISLQFNKWYDVDQYHSATAVCDGETNKLGTINLKFKTPTGQTSDYTYTATGLGDDTYLEWNPDSVIWYEGHPIPKTTKGLIHRPYKNIRGTQFLFSTSGKHTSETLTAFYKRTSTTPSVTPLNTTADLITQFSPTFIIWKLNYAGSQYYVEPGFPKFTKSFTTNSGTPNVNWNNPQNWTTFDSWT